MPYANRLHGELGCKAYLRYVDDFLLFADDKKTLWRWRAEIVDRRMTPDCHLWNGRLKIQDLRGAKMDGDG